MITLKAAENALKEVYLGVISNELNNCSDVVLGKIKQTSKDIWGKEIVKNVYIDGKCLTFKEELENIYANIEISDKALRVSQYSKGAFVDLFNSEIENMMKQTQNALRNAFYTEDIKPEYLPKDFNYTPIKINGLKKLFDTNSKELYGLSRKEYKELNPVIEHIEKFDPIKIQEIIDNNNEEVDVMICSSKVKRECMQYLMEHRQNIDFVNCGGGYKCFKFNNTILMCVAKIPDNEIYLLNTEDFVLHQLCDWEWLEDANGNILRQDCSKPIYRATLVKYANYICENPYKQIKIILGE